MSTRPVARRARAVVYMVTEQTFVVFFWVGLWQLLDLTTLLRYWWFCALCVAIGAAGQSALLVHELDTRADASCAQP